MRATEPATSFIVRVSVDPAGRLARRVARGRTGEKRWFDATAAAIPRMIPAGEEEQS